MTLKGERVTCLACNGSGVQILIRRGVQTRRKCIGCNGKGYIVAD